MGIVVDPIRRALPLDEWPPADQALWRAALTAGDLFDRRRWRGPLGGQNPADQSSSTMVAGSDISPGPAPLTPTTAPADRVTREAVRAYHQHLATLVAPITRLSMLVGLKVMMQAMAPDRSWRWLQDVCNRIQITARPSKDKRSRMRPTAEIVAAALRELESLPCPVTTIKQALAYRDAFMLALMAARPLRVKNFAGLELERHLTRTEHNWLITIPADETKTKQPIAFDLPEMLLPWLERYLSEVRIAVSRGGRIDQALDGQGRRADRSAIDWHPHHQADQAPVRHVDQSASAARLRRLEPRQRLRRDGAGRPALLGHRHRSTTEKLLHPGRQSRGEPDARNAAGKYQTF